MELIEHNLMRRRVFALGAVIALSLSGSPYALEDGSTKDPTVPPAAWLAAQPKAPGAPVVEVTGGDASSVRVTIVGKTRRFALIDGQVVKVGDIHNGSKVVAIRSGEVVVEDATKSLKMAPGVEKKMIKPVTPKKPAKIAPVKKSATNGNETGSRQ